MMSNMSEVLRYVAFSDRPDGGNPAGVVLDAAGLSDDEMRAIAAEVGYSETAFVDGDDIRYFSPLVEISFCGHATVATSVALAERDGPGEVVFNTMNGPVPVISPPADLDEILAALRWEAGDLDPSLPPRVPYAGAWHPVIGAASRERLAELDYDFERLGALMTARDWTTIQLLWREDETRFHARDPFPPGGVVEDPATGAAAAAFGGYLRELGLVEPPATITILQGEDLGRPSRLLVDIHADRPEIDVTGTAIAIG
jgi:predicted PhzF superfamily epimerase YddE/YHI9